MVFGAEAVSDIQTRVQHGRKPICDSAIYHISIYSSSLGFFIRQVGFIIVREAPPNPPPDASLKAFIPTFLSASSLSERQQGGAP